MCINRYCFIFIKRHETNAVCYLKNKQKKGGFLNINWISVQLILYIWKYRDREKNISSQFDLQQKTCYQSSNKNILVKIFFPLHITTIAFNLITDLMWYNFRHFFPSFIRTSKSTISRSTKEWVNQSETTVTLILYCGVFKVLYLFLFIAHCPFNE